MSVSHRYRIEPVDPAAHLFEVSLTVAEPHSDGQVFAMPAWIPGSYMIRDYARNVVAIRAESGGLDVALEKLDKSRWQAAAVDRPITIVAQVFAYDLSVRGAHLDMTHAYFNGPCVFLAVEGQEDLACEWMCSEMGAFLEEFFSALPAHLERTLGRRIEDVRPRWANGTSQLVARMLAKHIDDFVGRDIAMSLGR